MKNKNAGLPIKFALFYVVTGDSIRSETPDINIFERFPSLKKKFNIQNFCFKIF